MRLFPAVAAAALLAGPALAQDCPLPYPVFEFAVPHVDLDECPAEIGGDGVFCRASLAIDQLHVYVFADDDAQCLREVRSYGEDGFEITTE